MKIQLSIILAAACLAVAGCEGEKETSIVSTPGYRGVPEPVEVDEVVPEPDGGTEAPVTAESEEEPAGSPGGGFTVPSPSLPDGGSFGRDEGFFFRFRTDYGRYLEGTFEPSPPTPADPATIPVAGSIAMPAPTRIFRHTAIEWVDLTGGRDTGGHSKLLSCFDKTDHPTGVLAGFIHQYSGEGNILGMRGVCEDVAEDGRVGQAAGSEGIIASLVADVTDLVGSGDPYYWRRCDSNEGGVGISQQRLTATTERLDKLDLYCSAGETGTRFDPSNHTGSASAAAAASCPDGKFMFGVVVRYDWRGIRAIDSIGCAKPAWVPVHG